MKSSNLTEIFLSWFFIIRIIFSDVHLNSSLFLTDDNKQKKKKTKKSKKSKNGVNGSASKSH